jgi:chromosome segregation ATPase
MTATNLVLVGRVPREHTAYQPSELTMSFLGRFRRSGKESDDAMQKADDVGDSLDPQTPGSPATAHIIKPDSALIPASSAVLDEDSARSEAKITVEDEPSEDPERSQLEKVVRQRDGAISTLERVRLEKQQQLAAMEAELEKERLTQMKEALLHKIESERIKRQTASAEERLKCLESDMQDKAAIHEYANLIKGVAPKAGVDSQYVMKLQSQLQKAVAKMEATTEQMNQLEENSREVVDSLTAEIAELVEDRCRTELELRKQLEVLEVQKKDMQADYEERIRENLKTLQALKAKATSQTSIEELEQELEETESKLEELQRIQEKQQKTVNQLNKSLAAQENAM